MASRKFENVSIRGIAGAVPESIRTNQDILGDAKEIQKTAKTVGIKQRHIADETLCTSDLCYAAANQLLNDLNWERESVDVLIFLSQTPDYVLPATSCLLQHRLGLSKQCAAFDMVLGCSGYIYGLLNAFSLISETGIKRVLLLVGDTVSKLISPDDVASNVLFGDAGTATAIEWDAKAEPSYFVLGTDGGGANALMIEAGGFRKPTTEVTRARKRHPKDNIIRSEEELFMDGATVFGFTLSCVPQTVNTLMTLAQQKLDEVNFWLFHQANKFMLDYLGEKIGIDSEKIPMNITDYGNTSPPSIPLLAVTHGKNYKLDTQKQKIGLLGFGVGLSWGGALLHTDKICLSDLVLCPNGGD